MKTESWEFYVDDTGLFRWRLMNCYGRITAMALDGFSNREDCLEDARINGFAGDVTTLLFVTI